MWTAAVAFGQRVALLDPRGPAPTVPLRLLSPGDGVDLRRRAATARDRSEPNRDLRHREVLVPGRPSHAQRVRVEMLGADPQQVDEAARFRLFETDRADVCRYAVLGEWSSWRQRIGQLLDTVAEPGQPDPAPLPTGEWAVALADRPSLRDAPAGGGIPRGLGSWRAQALLDSIAARAVLIAALQGQQYADAAQLAETYPENQEFLTAEVSLALQIPESDARPWSAPERTWPGGCRRRWRRAGPGKSPPKPRRSSSAPPPSSPTPTRLSPQQSNKRCCRTPAGSPGKVCGGGSCGR